MDFFAGSCSFVHAALEVKALGQRNLKFIAIQLPETLDSEQTEQSAGYEFCVRLEKSPNIAEIGKERIRRVIKKIEDRS